MLKGQIIKNISNSYTIKCQNTLYICTPRGKFRQEKIIPCVGDYCLIDEENNYIMEILPRKNKLQRPNVSNIDISLIVTSLKNPDFNSTLLDKLISLSYLSKINPVLCFTKLDLCDDLKYFQKIKKYYEDLGILVFKNTELDSLKKALKNKLVVLTGQSGAGKSTILNKLDSSLKLKTDDISYALNRGKHTTRHTEIFTINDIFFCDTPGFSSLEFSNKTKEEIKSSFWEFQNYPCQYKDCNHLKELNCGVKKAIENKLILESRYLSYQAMLKEALK